MNNRLLQTQIWVNKAYPNEDKGVFYKKFIADQIEAYNNGGSDGWRVLIKKYHDENLKTPSSNVIGIDLKELSGMAAMYDLSMSTIDKMERGYMDDYNLGSSLSQNRFYAMLFFYRETEGLANI